MAILSNVNGKFAVDSTGAIQFSGSAGTSGYILRSNGNAAPTWVDSSTVIGGPYLPLTGGTLSGALAGTSATFSGILTAQSSSSGDYVRLYGSSGTGKWDIYGNGANLRISDNESAGILAVDTGATFGGNVGVGNSGTFDNPNSFSKVIEIANSDIVGLILNDTRDANPMSISNEGAVMHLRYNTTSLLSLIGSTGAATFSGTVTGQANNNTFGTASASGRPLTVQGNSSGQTIRLKNTLGGDGTISATGTANTMNYSFGTFSTNALFIQNDGKIGIGTNLPSNALSVEKLVSGDWVAEFKQGDSTAGNSYGVNIAGGTNSGDIGLRVCSQDEATEFIRVRGDGNVGIGYASPAKRLDVNYSNSGQEGASIILRNLSGGSGAYNRIYFAPTASDYATRSAIIQGENVDGNNNMALVFKTGAGATPSERMRIDQNGDISMTEGLAIQKMLSIGTNQTSGRSLLTIRNYDASLVNTGDLLSELLFTGRYYSGSSSQLTTAGINLIKENADGYGYGGALAFDTGGGAEAMRITSAGHTCFGTTSVANVVAGDGSAFGAESSNRMTLFQGTNSTAAMTMQAFYNPNGQVGRITLSGSATTYYTSSDYRLKEDLKDFEGLKMIDKIPVYDFKWKADKSRSYGVIAHEIQEVLPDAVGGEKDGEERQMVDYSKIVPLLVKSIQELEARIKELENK